MDHQEERIASKDVWTYNECEGLAAEFNVKTRMIILMVHELGKTYVDAS